MNHLDMTLTDTGVQTFTPELKSTHQDEDHNIPTIPANFDVADALQFVFDGAVEDTAQVIQDYVDGDSDAINLVEGIRHEITSKSVCMVCLKRELRGQTVEISLGG